MHIAAIKSAKKNWEPADIQKIYQILLNVIVPSSIEAFEGLVSDLVFCNV